MPSVIDSIGGLISSFFNAIASVLEGVLGIFQSIINTFFSLIATLFSTLGTAVNGLAETFSGLLKFLLSTSAFHVHAVHKRISFPGKHTLTLRDLGNIVVIGFLIAAVVVYQMLTQRSGKSLKTA